MPPAPKLATFPAIRGALKFYQICSVITGTMLLLLCAALVAAGAWEGVLRRGWGRVAGLAVSGVALAGGVLVLGDEGYLQSLVLLGVGALIWHAAARAAFRPNVTLPAAARPQRPVVVVERTEA